MRVSPIDEVTFDRPPTDSRMLLTIATLSISKAVGRALTRYPTWLAFEISDAHLANTRGQGVTYFAAWVALDPLSCFSDSAT